jgi:methionine-rich copper-binding protein CopC
MTAVQRTRFARLVACYLSALGLLWSSGSWILFSIRAEAHAIIMESEPPSGATVSAPRRVILRFNSRLEKSLCSVLLVGPGRRTILLLRQDERARADTLAYAVPELPPGDYEVRWKVLAADGHVTEGVIHFHVVQEALPK